MGAALRLGVSCAVAGVGGALVACSASHAGSNESIAVTEAGTPGPGDDAGPGGGAFDVVPTGPGHVVFLHPDGKWRRLAASAGSAPDDLTAMLDAISPGKDQTLTIAPDGAWIAGDSTGRFGCSGGGDCVIWASADGAHGGDVRPGGAQGVPYGRPAIAPGGGAVVYPKAQGGRVDLVASIKSGDAWGPEVVLTASSPYPYAHDPAFAPDGSRVAFDCGPSPYQDPTTSICEASVDGSSFRIAVKYTDGPVAADGGGSDWLCHHPGYAPDGSIVFEADWGPGGNHDEAIWRAPPGGKPERVSPSDVHDDNSPCVLPDGRIASLWLGRVASDGAENALHEIKVMDPDGSNGVMLLEDVDVVDVGLSCGD